MGTSVPIFLLKRYVYLLEENIYTFLNKKGMGNTYWRDVKVVKKHIARIHKI